MAEINKNKKKTKMSKAAETAGKSGTAIMEGPAEWPESQLV